ncbi:uncharacterized protein LOC122503805 [Leptopilina heterotoma]|uniref:uncharacterized protein LOC122503805 n=1 Tax=Leptopilina heterotoma TaxID=63436 RepID=UPI001CA85BE0|nr:uncharacterized protein LOC122503805 [Leptopilina heterotoma]XP_043470441.1 uncharacterized protein LOC122503805 [Leptopilina heterotoma]XP_043470442.1 uncharacterized protein LOC122503805 [Leptopilina heterotoma]XP_043470443.1 uncharacterized protein LOC122503805 [Leptopilina heterotoma]XP_043470444.1 uncharacterized protein LOC122503805 [Leptopilina heterotoma]XP_043470445.1 uncharacterized protein LOC122503805 [Leptopilina heterotoma]XP_043470446.1 uncharacterized protein LOC122503805 [
MKFIRIYFLCFTLWMKILAVHSTISLEKPPVTNYFDGLVNYLKNKPKLHQVVFILDDKFNNADSMMNSLIKTVDTHFPSFTLNYDEILVWFNRGSTNSIKSHSNYRRTTLFVFAANNEISIELISKYLDRINSMTHLSLPRCLIMKSFTSTHNYLNHTLYSFWRKSYLDITIMTYNRQTHIEPFLSQLNPFLNNYTSARITSKSQWFPNKVQNLNGYKMFFNFYTISGTLKERLETRKKITEIFERSMNFKHTMEAPDVCKLHYLGFRIQKYTDNNVESAYNSRNLRILKIGSIKTVIPKTKKFTKVLTFSPELLYMICGTVGIIVVIRLSAFLMKFNRTTLQILNISQIIMGMPSNQQPNYLLERIVFGSLLIACIFYTGYFYSVILDISFQPEEEISSLDELANSSLIPFINDGFCLRLKNSSIPVIKKLGDMCLKSTFKTALIKNYYCLDYLVEHNNVSCMYADAEYHVNTYSAKKEKELNVKILPEVVDYYTFHWVVANNSPFTDRYNEIILRASEFGLFNNFYISNLVAYRTRSSEKINKEQIFFITYYVLGLGFCISLIIFLIEILINKFKFRLR